MKTARSHLPPVLLIMALTISVLSTGCVSNRFKPAPKNTTPAHELNAVLAHDPLEAGLRTLITYNGPGSWKRNAFWDEYVVTLRNPAGQPITVSAVALVDLQQVSHPPGSDPWKLEKQSKTLERRYKDLGLAFVRYTAPGVIILGAGVGAVASVGVFSSAAAGVATATVVALPLYYLGVMAINSNNKAAMEREFNRRRLSLPLTLGPGETRTGSLFFPMVPAPRSLNLQWSTETTAGESVLSLGFLGDLHLQSAIPSAPAKTQGD